MDYDGLVFMIIIIFRLCVIFMTPPTYRGKNWFVVLYFRYHGEWTQHTKFVCQVHCEVRGSLEPPCNAVGFVDRLILGEDHLYQRPVYIRTEVIYLLSNSLLLYWIYCHLKFNLSYLLNDLIRDLHFQECSVNSPDYGPLPPNSPGWCLAPFDPEGILRWKSIPCSLLLSFLL